MRKWWGPDGEGMAVYGEGEGVQKEQGMSRWECGGTRSTGELKSRK